MLQRIITFAGSKSHFMKRTLPVFIILLFSAFLFIAPSCTEEHPTTGILSVTVLGPDGTPLSAGQRVVLATSFDNMKNKVFVNEGWTNESGYVKFIELAPGWYWYGVEGWKEFSATQLYSGVDHHVVLWVHTETGK